MKTFHRHLAPQIVSEVVDSIKLKSLILPEVGVKWSDRDRSDYIANLFKNYPTGIYVVTSASPWYSRAVKDGYHRLQIIIDFIDDKIKLSKDFYTSDTEYGYEPLAGKTYSEIIKIAKKDPVADKMVDTFWSYVLNIEYHDAV